jgi:hypothetical protein
MYMVVIFNLAEYLFKQTETCCLCCLFEKQMLIYCIKKNKQTLFSLHCI